ncbi:MAG: hypothetical protein QW639_02685 [Candidatus Bathyarchaeia archaeon]
MSSEERPTIAVVLSLIGGVLILLGSTMRFIMPMYGWMGYGMMGGFNHMMGSPWNPFVFMGGLWLIGLVSGVLVIIGAAMLNARPAEHYAWGTIILVFSAISFLGMGGLLIGAILGIIGGVLALTFKPAGRIGVKSEDG